MPAALLAALYFLAVGASAGKDSLPSWFQCTCHRDDTLGCVCPSLAPPGGLAPADTPLFILFSHDDAITPEAHSGLRTIYEHGRNLDATACGAVATLFTLARGTNCSILQQLHHDGYEVASHTLNHLRMNDFSRQEVEAEVVGGRSALAATCGIPEADIAGFRTPYLQSRPTLRSVVHQAGFAYDSSLLERPAGSISRGLAGRIWPYSMGDGIPQNCAEWSPAQECHKRERYPGLFQVPTWVVMEWATDSRDTFQILKDAFDEAYNGNRAPLPIFIHTSWFVDHLPGMLRFMEYALSKPHTHFVTVRQLLAWMRNPTPAAKVTPASLGCGQPGGASATTEALKPRSQQQPAPPLPPLPVPRAESSSATPSADAAPGGKHRRQQSQVAAHAAGDPAQGALAALASSQPSHNDPSIISSSSIATTSNDAAAIFGGLSGGIAAMLILLAATVFVVKRRHEPPKPAATADAMPHGSWSRVGVTAYVSSGGAAGSAAAKGRAAQLVAEDSSYSSSPRFTALTPRTRMGSMA